MKPEELRTVQTWARAGGIRKAPSSNRWTATDAIVLAVAAAGIAFLTGYYRGFGNGYSNALAQLPTSESKIYNGAADLDGITLPPTKTLQLPPGITCTDGAGPQYGPTTRALR